jgi:hypothetical protein
LTVGTAAQCHPGQIVTTSRCLPASPLTPASDSLTSRSRPCAAPSLCPTSNTSCGTPRMQLLCHPAALLQLPPMRRRCRCSVALQGLALLPLALPLMSRLPMTHVCRRRCPKTRSSSCTGSTSRRAAPPSLASDCDRDTHIDLCHRLHWATARAAMRRPFGT